MLKKAHAKLQASNRTFDRVEALCFEVVAPRFLSPQPFAIKGYFQFKSDPAALFFGVAKEFGSINSDILDQLPKSAKLYGGMRFDSQRDASADWKAFKKKRFFLPRFEIIENRFCINLVKGDGLEKLLEELYSIRWNVDAEIPNENTSKLKQLHKPSRSAWIKKVKSAQATGLEKVVLAQRFIAEFSEKLCPWSVVQKLKERFFTKSADVSSLPYLFGLQIEGETFVGASPERLYLREGNKLVSEALAGTVYKTQKSLGSQCDELLSSNKDLGEHAYVTDAIETIFSDLCEEFSIGALKTKQAAHLTHLHRTVSGELKQGISDEDILKMLHPTPAVGGVPTKAALEEIQSSETFDRGWYAGPIGAISKERVEFAVAIRSGLIEAETLTLYGGCGIVAASDPEKEYEETRQKIQTLLSCL